MSDQHAEHPERYASSSRGPAYLCKKPWPSSCAVQCGPSGIVLSSKGNYRTAFFEAFPDTFIRGQGETIEEAEAAAWEKYQVQISCGEHAFVRRGTSEHGECSRCGITKLRLFRPVHTCTVCGKHEVNLDFNGHFFCIEHYLEVARRPKESQVVYPNPSKSVLESLFDDESSFELFYSQSVWDYEVLMECGLIPSGTDEHLISRFIFDDSAGINLATERRNILKFMYGEWLESANTGKISWMMMSGIEDRVFGNETNCKTASYMAIIAAGLCQAKGKVSDDNRVLLTSAAHSEFHAQSASFQKVVEGFSNKPEGISVDEGMKDQGLKK